MVVHASETGCISQSSWHIPGPKAAHAPGPLCFRGCVFLWSPQLVRSPSLGRALRPYPSHLIRKAGSGLKQPRQGPNFHSAFWVTCLLISTFLEERSKKKKKGFAFSLTDGILKYPQKWRRRTYQLLLLPHEYIFQVHNPSFTMYK